MRRVEAAAALALALLPRMVLVELALGGPEGPELRVEEVAEG